MPFPNSHPAECVAGAGGMQGAIADMESSTGVPKAGGRRAFTPGGHGGAWLGKLAWQCRKLTLWVWFHLGCRKQISSGKTSRFFWKASSYLSLKIIQPVSSLLAHVCYIANLAF